MNKRYVLILIACLLVLTACAPEAETPVEKPEDISVVGGGKGEYPILLPFVSSPLRQEYAVDYRETDLMEIGRGLRNKSKEYFDPANYFVSEGSLLTPDRYYELLGRESDTNVFGLNKEDDFEVDGVVLKRPQFVSNLIELNFHKSKSKDQVDAVSVAMVMKRIQILDPDIGTTYRVSDDVLYQVGINLGQQLHSYMRSLEGMGEDVPIFIALYVQESDEDSLPGKYLPGHFIGHANFESSRVGDFVRTQEVWDLLNSETVLKSLPETYSDFTEVKRRITKFMGDESVGVVGKAFMNGPQIQRIQIEITTGAKTALELSALAETVKSDLSLFDELGVDITVNVMIYQNTRYVIHKDAGQEAQIIELN